MGKINIDSILLSSGKNAELNTWNYYNKVMPNIQKTSEQIILKTDTYTCKINNLFFCSSVDNETMDR